MTTSVVRSPMRSATAPRTSVPTAPASSIRKSSRLPSAFEWPSETTQSGTNASSVNHATLRSAITTESSAIARRRSSPRASSPRAAERCQQGQVRRRPREDERRAEDGHHRDEPADEPEPDDELPGHERAEGVADVPAAVEVRHAARPLVAARVRGELGALGMERRNSEPAGENEQQDERVVTARSPRRRCRRRRAACRRESATGRLAGRTTGRRAAERGPTTRLRRAAASPPARSSGESGRS